MSELCGAAADVVNPPQEGAGKERTGEEKESPHYYFLDSVYCVEIPICLVYHDKTLETLA